MYSPNILSNLFTSILNKNSKSPLERDRREFLGVCYICEAFNIIIMLFYKTEFYIFLGFGICSMEYVYLEFENFSANNKEHNCWVSVRGCLLLKKPLNCLPK